MDRSETPKAEPGRPEPTHAPTQSSTPPGEHRSGAVARLCDWRQFHLQLRDAAIASFRTGSPLALLLAEVRDLEQAGESLDEALIQLFAATVGEGGAVVRYGHGTLIAILPDTDVEGATGIAAAFQQAALTDQKARNGDSIELLSAAISGYDPDEPLSHLLKRGFDQLRVVAGQQLPSTSPT